MRRPDTPPSTHFEDRTMQSPMEGYARQVLDPRYGQPMPTGAPGGYDKWLTDWFRKMKPKDYARMHEQGLQIQDIAALRDKVRMLHQNGQTVGVDFRQLYYPNDFNSYPSVGDLVRGR